ncbi:hypothetical protein RRG08_034407 [Elysia crispata]|uniref:Uncharacterized protein n=1 Tax=Elysia crispata TaxID=231223 RepID=A0AAE1CWP4_9GAST|nr:hypothetical protein RRG08_034407 [Elysia crispata]
MSAHQRLCSMTMYPNVKQGKVVLVLRKNSAGMPYLTHVNMVNELKLDPMLEHLEIAHYDAMMLRTIVLLALFVCVIGLIAAQIKEDATSKPDRRNIPVPNFPPIDNPWSTWLWYHLFD